VDCLRGEDLSRFTTIKIGGKADYLLFPSSYGEVKEAILFSKEKDLPLFLLGGGSNTIPGDIGGVVVGLSKLRGMKVISEGDTFYVEVLAGTPLKEVISLSIKENLEGIYKLAGFPATVGGAVAMNAGAFGVEFSNFLKEVLYVSWSGELVRARAEELVFSYRSSPFPKEGIVLSCTLELRKARENVLEDFKKIRRVRKDSQPINQPTSGSTFKNPNGNYAGRLLELVGMKGCRVGNVAFSEKHANFMVNLGGGTFEQVKALVEEAKRRVFEEFGIVLEEEVRLVESCGSDGWKVL